MKPRLHLALLGVVGAIAAFQLLSVVVGSAGTVPGVPAVARAIGDMLGESGFWARLGETLQTWAAGFALALVAGIPLGLTIGLVRPLFRTVRLLIDVLRPIPSIAVLPLAVLTIGSGIETKVYLVAFASFFPILFQALYGARDIDPVARETLRAYQLGRGRVLRHLVLPSALPYIATGLRLAATIGLVVAIAAELVIGSTGLGYQISQVQYASDTPAMYALVVATGVLGLTISMSLRRLERWALYWHPSQRREVHL